MLAIKESNLQEIEALLTSKIFPPKEMKGSISFRKEAEALLVYGLVRGKYYKSIKPSLKKRKKIVILEDNLSEISHFLQEEVAKEMIQNSHIEIFYVQDLDSAIKKFFWDHLFQEIDIFIAKEDPTKEIEAKIHFYQEGIHLTASDYSDFGSHLLSNLFGHLKQEKSLYQLSDLKERFSNIPALIVGAGPSLDRDIEVVKNFPGYVFAGGSSLNALVARNCRADFAASIDPKAPFTTFKEMNHFETPFLFQMRASAQNIQSVQSSYKLLAPSNGGYPLEDWIMKELGLDTTPHDWGWTVSTFLVEAAHFMGFSPIVLVGMDLAHSKEKRYADGKKMLEDKEVALVKTKNREGHEVTSQRDWLFCKEWFKSFAKSHPKTLFDLTSDGIDLELERIELNTKHQIPKETIHQILGSLSKKTIDSTSVFASMEKSLHFLTELITDKLAVLEKNGGSKKIEEDFFAPFKGDLIYEKHLKFLWEIFKPIFMREFGVEEFSFALTLHQTLFFQSLVEDLTKIVKG